MSFNALTSDLGIDNTGSQFELKINCSETKVKYEMR